ncbi:uncharacterized protein LOC129898883 [Solanum dulcamara]|uniref:uncharacterized protein LOC129898883 n=1 Tax=Solanum dulcamara TaxID=45834 RepID=UPI0024861161|nr:uncharacterized protein LOC129898883 [Solanum dulcamara]
MGNTENAQDAMSWGFYGATHSAGTSTLSNINTPQQTLYQLAAHKEHGYSSLQIPLVVRCSRFDLCRYSKKSNHLITKTNKQPRETAAIRTCRLAALDAFHQQLQQLHQLEADKEQIQANSTSYSSLHISLVVCFVGVWLCRYKLNHFKARTNKQPNYKGSNKEFVQQNSWNCSYNCVLACLFVFLFAYLFMKVVGDTGNSGTQKELQHPQRQHPRTNNNIMSSCRMIHLHQLHIHTVETQHQTTTQPHTKQQLNHRAEAESAELKDEVQQHQQQQRPKPTHPRTATSRLGCLCMFLVLSVCAGASLQQPYIWTTMQVFEYSYTFFHNKSKVVGYYSSIYFLSFQPP